MMFGYSESGKEFFEKLSIQNPDGNISEHYNRNEISKMFYLLLKKVIKRNN